MILIQGYARVRGEDVPGLRALAETMIRATRAEPGCIHYSYAEDVLEPGLFHIIERWESQAALDAHMAAPHMQAFTAGLAKLKLEGVRVAAYEADAERVLIGG